MRTRTLATLSVTLLAAGLCSGAASLHPAIDGHPAMRIAVLLCIAAVFPWHAAQSRRAADATTDQLAAARQEGYRTGIMHAALGLLGDPHDGGHTVDPHASYAREHLHVITDHERKAE